MPEEPRDGPETENPEGVDATPPDTTSASLVGICVSGGGLRSASFGLGALQGLQAHGGLLKGARRADFLSAVSGGSYIAGAYAMVAQGAYDQSEHDAGIVSPSDPFALGSPEERHVRNNTRFLIDGLGGTLGTVGLALQRLVTMFALLFAFLFTAALPIGWIYARLYPTLGCDITLPSKDLRCLQGTSHAEAFHITPNPDVVRIFAFIAAAGVVVAMIAVSRHWGRARRAVNDAAAILIISGLVGLVAVAGLPELLAWVQRLRGDLRDGWLGKERGAVRDAIVIGVAILTASLIAALAVRTSSVEDAARASTGRGKFRRAVRRIRGPLMNGLAVIAGPLLFTGIALRVMAGGASTGLNGMPFKPDKGIATGVERIRDWNLLVASTAVVMMALWQGDVVQWSLHPVYRRRIGKCFAIARTGGAKPAAIARDHEKVYPLSSTHPDNFPELIISAAVNVSDRGETPAGTRVLPFIFSAREIGIPGYATFDTEHLERCYHGRGPGFTRRSKIVDSPTSRMRISLPSAIATTGAAISPAMGKMTRAPLRFLIGMFNLRLGVWLPNPLNEELASEVMRQGRIANAEDRVAMRSWPGPLYIFAEMLGRNTLRRKFIYVSDGGHYENLGIMELLRRKCSVIWCIDASGDPPGTARTLAEAIALARAELAVEIDIDLRAFELLDLDRHAPNILTGRNVTVGRVQYPDGTIGRLIVIKLGLSADDPSDLIEFQRSNPTFPYDSTGNQIYRAERFDAYRALGYHAATRAYHLERDGRAGNSVASAVPLGEMSKQEIGVSLLS